jgi:hypothetical protein
MKKIFSLALLVCGALLLNACKVTQGTEPGNDSNPALSIYPLLPGDLNPDTTFSFRVAANNKVSKIYVLVGSAEAEAATVKSQGTAYPGQLHTEIIMENMSGSLVASVVGEDASGNLTDVGTASFVGYDLIGTATIEIAPALTAAFGGPGLTTAEVYRSSGDPHDLKLTGPIDAASSIKLRYADDGSLTITNKEPAGSLSGIPSGFLHATYGMWYLDVDEDPEYTWYDEESQVLNLNFRRIVSAGSFSGWYDLTYTITLN